MRIALCLEYPIDQRGGTEVLVSELIKGLSQRHQVILVSPDSEAMLARSPVKPLITEHVAFTPDWRSASTARDLAQKIARIKPDLAHFHFGGTYGWGNRYPFHCPIYFLSRHKVPCISTVHLAVSIFDGYCGPQKPGWFKLAMLPVAWLGKLHQLRHVIHEVAVSQHDYQKLRRWYWPFQNRFKQIYHSRLPEIVPAPVENRAPVILNAGHIAWRKGQAILVEAFTRIASRHPDWTLQLAGAYTNEAIEPVLALIKKHRLEERVRLLGERSDALELMQSAAIYVQPSFWEALGLALQEAMFAGCACIGSRVGGIPELLQSEKVGVLFDAGNVDQLARALENFIGDRSLREQLARAAVESIRARGMTARQMVEAYLELYENVRQQ